MDKTAKKELFSQEFAGRLARAFEFSGEVRNKKRTARDVAEKIGITEASIRKYLGGSIPSADIASSLAHELDVYAGWLIAGEGIDPLIRHEDDDLRAFVGVSHLDERHLIPVPHLDVQASAGPGSFQQQEQQIGEVGFDDRWLRALNFTSPANARIITANGTSNEPLIRHADMLLVDTGIKEIGDTNFYVIFQNGNLRVKVCSRRMDGAITISSHNKEFDDKEEIAKSEADQVEVCGLVRWFGRAIA
jgi:phage repressor protein C with HTH and peptisase S24 domain